MDLQTIVMQYRYQLAIAISVSAIISATIYTAPRIGTIVAFFWPLIASTALFVAAIVAFSAISHLSIDTDKNPGNDIVEYVAGRHDDDHF